MRLFEFLERESRQSYKTILVIAVISGLANTLLVAIANHAAEAVINQEGLARYLLLYIISLTLFLQSQWLAFGRAVQLIEDALYSKRTRLTSKVAQLDLAYIDAVGSSRLYRRLTASDMLISQAVPQLVAASQIFALMVFSFVYLAYISPLTFLVTMAAFAGGVTLFMDQSRRNARELARVKSKEDDYSQSIAQLVDGFKEIKINRDKAADLVEHIVAATAAAQAIKTEVARKESRMWGFGRLFVYLLLPIALFAIPTFTQEPPDHLFKVSALLFFLMGPITILTATAPMLTRVNHALDDLFQLEQDIDAVIARTGEMGASGVDLTGFGRIAVEDMRFAFPGAGQNFSVGPFDQTIPRGELLFIIGGNGSGKSTFLKLFTGLYFPDQGRIRVDDRVIGADDYAAYRGLFSVIFTDFHLFDRLYGIRDADPAQVDYWLDRMALRDKVGYRDGGFSTRDLSTGQRKRLAFIAAMLEAKPILVLDEFAADQDPQFRRYFYETILPELKARGTTVIAVTHDDHYFHVADRILKMDEGRFVDPAS